MPAPEGESPARVSPAFEISQARTPSDRADFVIAGEAPFSGDPAWIAPLRLERAEHIDPEKNPALAALDHALWVARRDGRPIGRISAQVNPAHLDRYADETGQFGFFDAPDEPALAAALLGQAEAWLRERGMERIAGPFNFTINEECGVLVDGFETPPVLMMPHARPYYAGLIERAGYAKAKDLIAYDYDVTTAAVPERLRRLVDRLARDPSVRLRPLNRAAFQQDLATVMGIFNDAWSENWGFVPFSPAEIAHAANAMKPVLKDDWLSIAELNGEPVAFALALPNVNEAIADIGGRLAPFGWAKLLYRLKVKGLSSCRMPLMGVRKRLQGTTVGAALSFAVIDEVARHVRGDGVKRAELSWILDDNRSMRRLIEEIGARAYKTYRIYAKALV